MSFGRPKDDLKISEMPSSTTSSSLVTSSSGEKVEAFLGKGSKVVGALTFSGPVELDGYVEGEINSQDRLTVGEAAVINAKISGAEVLVKGTVNGDIYASKKLALKKPARVIGNISCTNLSIEEGVTFEGKSSMGSASRTAEVKPLTAKTLGPEKIGVSA